MIAALSSDSADAPSTAADPARAAVETGPFSPAYTRYVLGVALAVMIFNNADRTVLSILVEPIKAEFQMSDTQMGAAMGLAFTLVYTFVSLPVARLADFGVRRTIIAIGLFIWSGFTAATSLVQNFAQLFLMRMGVGIGEAAGTPPTLSLLSDYVPPSRRGAGLSVVSIGAITGMGLGMTIGGWINEQVGWRWAFVAAGLPGIALAAVVRWTVREPERGSSEGRSGVERPSVREAVGYLWGTPTYRYVLVANAFSLFAAMGRNLWEPSFLIRTYDLGTAKAGFWYFITSPIPSMLGIYLGGRFADVLGRRDLRWYLWVPALGQLVSVPILVAFLLWPESDRIPLPEGFGRGIGLAALPVAFVLSTIGSVFGSFFTAPFLATIQGVSRLRMRALAAAMSTAVSSFVGLAAGPLLVGVLSDAFQHSYGEDALRYSLLVPTLSPVLSSLVAWWGAHHVQIDLGRARAEGA